MVAGSEKAIRSMERQELAEKGQQARWVDSVGYICTQLHCAGACLGLSDDHTIRMLACLLSHVAQILDISRHRQDAYDRTQGTQVRRLSVVLTVTTGHIPSMHAYTLT